jgi:glucose/arabinose dehydrogenase
MQAPHSPRIFRHVLGVGLLALLVAGCAKKDQSARAAPPAGSAPASVAQHAAPESAPSAPSGSPGAGATEAPEGIVPVPGPSARNGPPEPPQGPLTLSALKLPPGFSIEVYSAAVPDARSLALGPRGVVFVSNRRGDDVYALVDDNGDGHVDRVQVIVHGLDTPNGIAYRDGSLFIAQIGRLLRIDGIDTKLDHPPEPKLVTDQLP